MTKADHKSSTSITIIGAGILGLWQAYAFAQAGFKVTLYEKQKNGSLEAASSLAGAMLAPNCEREASEAIISTLGHRSIEIWKQNFPEIAFNGTLVVAHARDLPELERFAKATPDYQWLKAQDIAELEPDLADRFSRALYYEAEGHVNPRAVMAQLIAKLETAGVVLHFACKHVGIEDLPGQIIDCRGIGARDQLDDLRGVKGEMAVLRSNEIKLSRPIRFMHPRHPLYIVPWGEGLFMVGATMIEADNDQRITAKSMLELLSSAYSLNPSFGEAEIVEMRAGVRPAFPDNLPRIIKREDAIYVNGIYRHGFLLAPIMAEMTVDLVKHGKQHEQIVHED